MTIVYSETFFIHFKRAETKGVDKHLSQKIKKFCFNCPRFVNLPVILKHWTPVSTNKIEMPNVKQFICTYHIGKI